MKKLLLSSLALSIMVFSCSEEEENPSPANTSYENAQSISEESRAQREFDDAFSIVEDAMEQEADSMGKISNFISIMGQCATYTLFYTDSSILIEFDSSKICNDLRTRSGKIEVDYTGRYRDSGTVITTTLVNYTVNGNAVEGTKIVENKGRLNGNLTFDVTVSNGKITWEDGSGTSTYNSNYTRTWTSGENTTFFTEGSIQGALKDDVYELNGNSSGLTRDGVSYTSQISNVVVELGCWIGTSKKTFYPVSGTKSITTSGGTTELDFSEGGGACDNTVRYTGPNGLSLVLNL